MTTPLRALVNVDPRPDTTAGTNATVAAHTAHLARLLRGAPYPPSP